MHEDIYDFWFRSIGVWQSQLSVLTVDWLDKRELSEVSNIHHLSKADFGIKMNWNYKHRKEDGCIFWSVSREYKNLIFPSQSFRDNMPLCTYQCRVIGKSKISFTINAVDTVDTYEETIFLKNNECRTRELRLAGRLIRRLRENRLNNFALST
jgi:hypothetical protein